MFILGQNQAHFNLKASAMLNPILWWEPSSPCYIIKISNSVLFHHDKLVGHNDENDISLQSVSNYIMVRYHFFLAG